MAVAPNGIVSAVAATNGVTSQAFAVAPGGTLLSGTATMVAGFAIISPSATPITVTSVTDSQGNTWTKVTEQAAGSGWDTTGINAGAQRGHTLSIWYTTAATINTTITITANFSGTTDTCVGLFTSKFTGVATGVQFDNNVSLPKVGRTTTNASPSISGISTNTSNIYPISFLSCFSSNISSGNVSFNGVLRNDNDTLQHNGTEFLKGTVQEGPAPGAAYSGVSYSFSASIGNSWHIGLALTADVVPAGLPTTARVLIVG